MKAIKKLSIVIISKNEEKNIGKLLESIRKQRFPVPYEVILADANSKDSTKKIAKRYGVKIFRGGLPSVGRNAGARHATGDLLLFLDADTILPKGFIEHNLQEFTKRDLSVATPLTKINSQNEAHALIFKMWNRYVLMTQKFDPSAIGYCILCSARVHKNIGGFDEHLRMFEDFNYVGRAAKHGKFGVLRSVPIITSVRRFEKDGTIYTTLRAVTYVQLRKLMGDRNANKFFKYDFNHGKHEEKRLFSAYLSNVNRALVKCDSLIRTSQLKRIDRWLKK